MNSFGEYDPVGNPARQLPSFKVDGFVPCGAPPCGQLNTACATLLVNGAGAQAEGPIDISVPGGSVLGLSWAGPAGQPIVLAGTPAFVVGQHVGGSVIVDLDLSTFSILLDGTDPFWGALFATNAAGSCAQSFTVPPAAAGGVLRVQGAIFDAANTCSGGVGLMTTSSYALHF